MGTDLLFIYLNDHLALLTGEGELLQRCLASNAKEPFAQELRRIETESKEQQQAARELLKTLGGSEDALKQTGAWLAEKLGRLKGNGRIWSYSPLSRVLEFEVLISAAQERIMMWTAFESLVADDPRFLQGNWKAYRQQAENHRTQLERLHADAVQVAFLSGGSATRR